jgi:hypothetical protein
MLAKFNEMRFEYVDTDFTRTKEGVVLPDTTRETVQRLNQGFPWETWGGLRLAKNRCLFVRPDGSPLLFSTVRNILGDIDTPVRSVLPYLTCPNGQVKNFLNCCRAVGFLRSGMAIAVIGSKSMEGGGSWHQYFIYYLLLFEKDVIVDFYDYSEIPLVKSYKSSHATVTAEWISSPFEPSLQKKYDVIIDDAWTITSGPGLSLSFTGQYSWKGKGENSVPFLHPSEERTFSQPPKTIVITGCKCPTCRVIKEAVNNYDQYLLIRTFCGRLGYDAPCVGVPNLSDMRGLAEMLRRILSEPYIEMERQGQLRYLISLCEEVGIEVRQGIVRRVDESQPITNRFSIRDGEIQEETYSYFEKKSVVFSGVSPSILGLTKIQSHRIPEIMFVSSLDVLRMHDLAPIVFCAIPPSRFEAEFPNYQVSGRRHKEFFEYILRSENGKEKNLVPVPSLQTPLSQRLPVPFFHKVLSNVNLGTYSGPKKDYRIHSLKVENGVAKLTEFDSSLWRQSIYLNVDGTWGPIKMVISDLGWKPGFLALSVPLPWDMTVKEVKLVEGNKFEEQRKHPYHASNPSTIEWEYDKGRYIRSSRVHPVSWASFEDIDQIILRFRKEGYYEGFEKMVSFLANIRSLYEK